MNPTNFFGELRRRNVYRVAVAYGIVAWLITQVATQTFGFLLYQRFYRSATSADRLEKSIAVLPFENFSDDKENAFFADGIQDDILTSLAKIRDLKVISRTSVMVYRGAAKNNLPQIAQALGVVNR